MEWTQDLSEGASPRCCCWMKVVINWSVPCSVSLIEMDPTKMLWKTQLLELVSEAPKAVCIECNGISKNHRFFSAPSTPSASGDDVNIVVGGGGGGSESDLSGHSIGLSSNNGVESLDGNGHIHDFESVAPLSSGENSLEKLTHIIQVNLQIVDSLTADTASDDCLDANNPGGDEVPLNNSKNRLQVVNDDVVIESLKVHENGDNNERRRSSKTAAAPWHRPSIYYFNPFGSSFHGNLSRPSVKRLLAEDGHYLVRKRAEDGDDEFVLSVKFNGRVKNFKITFDDTSGLIYLESREKGFEHLEDLVQDGLVTMYVEHRAGPYIDLLYDLTRNDHHRLGGGCSKYLDSLKTNNRLGGAFTADCIYEFFENSGNKPGESNGGAVAKPSNRFGGQKQNSPSPVSSLSGSSLERVRQPDLKSHSFKIHTFQQLSKCQICLNFLWGLSSQGLLCQHCGLTIHEACIAKVQHECEPDLTQFATIFGISLTLLVKATPGCRPPFLLQKCISEIDKRGLHVEGIYRISGSREASDRLKTLLERDRDSADLAGHSDIHSMCSIVKQFLRLLPEPLISEEVFHTFLNSNTNTNLQRATPATTVDSVRRELKKLPPAHYITLKYLLQHLHRVAERSEQNKMNPFNLSSVFAPSLLPPAQISIETLQTGTVLLELMITHQRNLFPK
ncbi:N-chimaerin isoform X2 [Folsomia candida]|uniref:N-chimaerin isoform X2 n=1 Tax=Folsomia candida TaxID=158441 RepID=UPI0016053437|nr:N-chimaerin isoform X2 [Folsomia candida]